MIIRSHWRNMIWILYAMAALHCLQVVVVQARYIYIEGMKTVNLNEVGTNSINPLFTAVRRDSMEEILALVKLEGAEVNKKIFDPMGITYLHRAIERGDPAIVKIFLDFPPPDWNLVDKDGLTFIHYAINSRNITIVDLLVIKGCSLMQKDREGKTSLHYAALTAQDDMILFILIREIQNIDIIDHQNSTALHLSADHNCVKCVQLLANKKAALDRKDVHGRTPLMLASARGYIDIVHILMKAGANPNLGNQEGQTPLHLMVTHRDFQTAKMLLSHPNINVNAIDHNGRTALHWAIVKRSKKLISILLQHKINVNIADVNGKLALHIALAQGRGDFASLLLQAGSDVNHSDHEGKFPLDYAIERDLSESIKLIVEMGGKSVLEIPINDKIDTDVIMAED